MSANQFVLKHEQIEVDYTIGATPGLTALTYTDGTAVMNFTSAQITTEETSFGSLVSFPLQLTIDTGGERFGFFLPVLDVVSGNTQEFTTVGVSEKFSGPDSFPRIPPSWSCIELDGTAQTVMVPLVAIPPPPPPAA